MEEFLKIETPQWRREGVLEEQGSLIEDMSSYFIKWREQRNGDLGSKSSMFIKGEEKDEEMIAKQPINQSKNQQISQSTT